MTHMMQIVSQWYEVRRQSYMEQWKEMDVVEWGVCWKIAVQGVCNGLECVSEWGLDERRLFLCESFILSLLVYINSKLEMHWKG